VSFAQQTYFGQDSIFVFGGIFTKDAIGKSLLPGVPSYEDNYIIGAAYQRHLYEVGLGIKLGAEVGFAGRFGDATTGEVWGGLSIRTPGFNLGSGVMLTPGIVIGLSGITDSMGQERIREISTGGDATVLGYLGPEVAFTFASIPNMALVYRVHHRSGLFGNINGMREGYNAQVLGVRWSF
jgi:hypothetical protein